MHYYSIYTRLLAGISALLFVVLAVPFVYFSYTLETDMQKDAHDIAINSLNSVEWVLSQQKFSGLAELDAWTEGEDVRKSPMPTFTFLSVLFSITVWSAYEIMPEPALLVQSVAVHPAMLDAE